MRSSLRLAFRVGLALGMAAAGAQADVWDIQTENDNTLDTENELHWRSDQLHDLGAMPGPAADQDWYRISQKPFSSYEVVADATSGDISDRGWTVDGRRGRCAVIQSSVAVGIGYTRSLRWANDTAAEVNDERIRVMSDGCTTDCGPEDVYRLRVTETTYWIPRFNNFGTQITILLLQNPTNYVVNATVYFWSTNGADRRAAVRPAAEGADGVQHRQRRPGRGRSHEHRPRRTVRGPCGQDRRAGAVDRLQLRQPDAPAAALSRRTSARR